MKKILMLCLLLFVSISLLFAQPTSFAFTPNSSFGRVIATVEINGIPASSADWIAAFDEDGNCAGAGQLIEHNEQTFCSLLVYGDDYTTGKIDEGINSGETFTLKLWVAATNQVLEYVLDVSQIFGWNQNLNGSAILGYSFQNEVLLNFIPTELINTQTINLNAGWNLISFDVRLTNNSVESVFSSLQYPDIVSTFDSGTKTYYFQQPIFINNFSDIENGFGYWVHSENALVLMVEGVHIADDFRKPLNAGWNLIAYPPDAPQAPATYFADLIAAGNLEFVAGFDNEIKFFDPNQPAFLNTLLQMENGRGYWVKVTNATN